MHRDVPLGRGIAHDGVGREGEAVEGGAHRGGHLGADLVDQVYGEVPHAGLDGARDAVNHPRVGGVAAFRVVVQGTAGVGEEGEVPEGGGL